MAETRTYQGYTYERTADGWVKRGPAAPIGGIFSLPSPGDEYKTPKAAADAKSATVNADAAPAMTAAEVRIKNATATKLERDNAAAAAADNGDTGLSREATVQAVIDGRMSLPAAGLRSPYWQKILADVAAKDPNFDLINYNARAATRKDFTSGKSSANIKALNTALGHLGELNDQISGTYSAGGSSSINPLAHTMNAIGNAYDRNRGASGITKFEQTAGALAGELTQVYRQSGGAEADIQRYIKELDPNASEEQKRGAVQNMAKLLKSRLDAINDQYVKGMGTSAQPLQVLDPHAQEVLANIGLTGPAGGNNDVPKGGAVPPTGGGSGPTGGGGTPGGMTIATGKTQDIPLDRVNSIINRMVRSGASADEIGKAVTPYGFGAPGAAEVARARQYLKDNPGYKGSFGGLTKVADTSLLNQAAGSTLGAFASGAGTGVTAGALPAIAGGLSFLAGDGYENGRDQFAVKQALLRDAHPGASLLGNIAGAVPAMAGTEIGATAAGLGKLALPASEAAYGAVAGGNEGGITGALEGAALAPIGGLIGRKVIAPIVRPIAGGVSGAVRGVADKFGVSLPGGPAVQAPSAADRMVYSAAQKAGVPSVEAALNEASQLGVPMALADTNPALRSLAGAAVRRSPQAAQVAESALVPRARGQIDRLQSAVTRDLGPVANVPQLSQDLTQQARTAAAPLYAASDAAPAIGSPNIDSLLNTPFGREAVGKARTIAANERVDPKTLGFSLDDAGNVNLNPVPNDLITAHASARADLDAAQEAYKAARTTGGMDADTARQRLLSARDNLRTAESALSNAPTPGVAQTGPQYTPRTMDYVTRGMDDVLEQYRNPISGKLDLSDAGRAQAGVRSSLVDEIGNLNPANRAARQAYAGPVQARDALARGQDAYTLAPDELDMQVSNQTPEHLAQMQLGFRSELMNRANNVRDASNPFEATLGNPNARARVETLYPDNAGTDNLFRQRDLEGQLARTNNSVLGNSMTAERQIADRAFTGSALPALAMDAGAMAMGQVPLASISRSLGTQGLRDILTLGLGKQAVQKADDIAPTLLNTDPQASLSILSDLASKSTAYRDYINSLASRRISGSLGASLPPAFLTAQP